MKPKERPTLTRREMLKLIGATAGGAVVASAVPGIAAAASAAGPLAPRAIPPAQEKITLSLWFGDYPQDIFKQAFDLFETNTGIHIDWLDVPEYWVKVPAAAAAGELPDIVPMGDTDVPTLAVKNAILPLNQYASGKDLSDFVQSALAHSSWKGELYGMPYECGPSMWVYNKGLIKEAGLEDPWELAKKGQWDQAAFDVAIKTLTKGEAQWGVFEPSKSLDIQGPFISGYSGQVWNDDFSQCLVNSPEALAAFTYILGWKWNGYAAEPSDAIAGHTGILPLFNAGYVGFVFFPRGLWPALNHEMELGLAPPFRFLVTDQAYTRHGVNLFSAKRDTKYPEQCWEFLHFFATEGNDILVKNQAGTPNRRAALDAQLWLDTLGAEGWEDPEAWKMGFDALIPTLSPPGYYEINDLIQAAYESVYLREKSLKVAFDEAVGEANKILAEQAA
jgi:ABC-type glycerol-3-phosphate transport system substrate-binding protein